MHDLKRVGIKGVALGLGVAMVLGLGPAVAYAADGDAGTTAETAPPTTAAPTTTTEAPTTEASAPAEEAAPSTTTTTTTVPSDEAQQGPHVGGRRWGPDPRWIDYGDCGSGINACKIAKAHQRQGRFQWRNGHWFVWGNDLVRGTFGETWRAFQIEANRLRRYLVALYVAQLQRSLVNRWSGVAQCESGGNWAVNTGNGYYGGLQFNLGTWQAYGGQGIPNERPAWYQAWIADKIRVSSGLQHWPVCGQYYG